MFSKFFNRFKYANSADLVYSAVSGVKLDQRDIERSFARLFLTDDGKKVLAYLQILSFHRAHGAETSNEQLRYAEGGRALVATIIRLIDKGRGA